MYNEGIIKNYWRKSALYFAESYSDGEDGGGA